jgi:hypothetical protein
MMKHADGNPAAPTLVQEAIVQAILQRGLGDTYNTLPRHVLEWNRMIVELPHHEGGLAITPLQASGMAAFYSATANLVAWLQSLPHASEWVAGQNLADPNTWTSSALHALKHLHEQLMQHCNCKEWGSPSVSPSHLPRPCGVRWGALGLQAIAMRAQLRSSRRRIMLLSSISSSGSSTILHSLLSRMCHADARGTLWVVGERGTRSIHALLILPIGLERTITS